MRLSLALVVLLNAFIPMGAAAADMGPFSNAGGAAGIPQPRELPVIEPVLYDPPLIPQPQETGPEGDEVPSVVPEKDRLEFYVVAAGPLTSGNRVVELTVTIRNHAPQAYSNLTFTDSLENGFEYSPSVGSPVSYDSQNNRVTYVIDSIAPGAEVNFTYSIRLTAGQRSLLLGKVWLHNANLADSGSLLLTAPVTIGVEVPAAADASGVAALRSGQWNALGLVNVQVSAQTIGEDAFLVVSPVDQASAPTGKGQGRGPALQFKLETYRTSAVARDQRGRPTEQQVNIQQKLTDGFGAPAFLEINLDGYVDLKNIPAGQELFVSTYDETSGVWVKVPILEIDLEANSVIVQAAHFSTWGAGLGSALPQNGANVLLFDQPYTSLFTGSSRYSIPIWTPAGRAGMAPDLTLSYSSGALDGVLGDVQGSWVGAGWNMDGVEIVRKITSNENGYGYVNDFALTLNGSLYELVQDTQHPSRYFTKSDAFLYIERHSFALGNENPTGSSAVAPNKTGEWWQVVTRDGTRYRLGWNADSEQLALMYGYSCTSGGINCTTPGGAYASLGYAGRAQDLVALRWRVDRVMDTHGNYMDYAYFESQPSPGTQMAAFDRESYLQSISFTGFIDPQGDTQNDLAPAYQVKLEYGNRSTIGDVPTLFNVWDNIDSKFLDLVKVCYGTCGQGGSALIRTYDLDYTLATVPNANGTLKLASIKMTAGGYTDPVSSQVIPSVTAPTIKFTYQNLDNRAGGAGDVFTYPRLQVIENGAGGKLTYTYENDGRGNNSWYNWRVSQVKVENGIGIAALQSYAYTTPVYAGEGGNPALGALFGYTATTETQLDYNNGNAALLATKHTFGTVGLDIGREVQTEWMTGSTVLRKSTSTYVTDNSKAPFLGWNNRYLYQSVSYVRSGSSLVSVSQTRYQRDPSTGNLLVQSDYLGTSLYRKTYYEYLVNADPAYNIIDKVSRALLVTAGNQIVSDTRYHYDGMIATAPTKGELTLTQRLTGSGSQTVDARTHYDMYGNVDQTYAYESYGSVNSDPTGDSIQSSTAYDTQTRTFPVQSTNPLGWTSSAAYIYALGVPYQSTDVNGWVTTTKYDGLGRTLSVTAPGLTQAGVEYQYPVPNASGVLIAPYSVEMQILDTAANPPRYRSVWGVYDGLGRTIQTQVHDDSNNQLLITTSKFNAQGLVSQQSLPFYVNAAGGNYSYATAPQNTDTTYDVLGRALTVTQPGNIQSQTSYDGLTTTSLDPNGNKVTRTTDGLGRLTYVVEYSAAQTAYATTAYTNDHADRLVHVNDANANVTTIQYNWLGQKTGMDDPDMGVWGYTYFAVGSINTQTDARACVTTFAYDDLGRMTGKSFSGTSGTCDSTSAASYGYDSGGILGARSSMSDGSGSNSSWSYSNYGRTVAETRGSFTMTTVSDWLGRPITMTYPDSDVVTYSYDALGRPDHMTSSDSSGLTLADLAYNALGQITSQALGNGVTVANSYNANTNRLSTRIATISSTTLLNLGYSYDLAGNITGLTDLVAGQSQTHAYQYDFLNRLTSAEAVQGADYVYRQQFEYDKVGNISQVNNWITPTPQGFAPGNSELAQAQSQAGAQIARDAEGSAFQPAAYHAPSPVRAEPVEAPAFQEPATDTPTATLTPSITNTPVPTNTPQSTSTPSNTPSFTPTSTPVPNPGTTNLIGWWSLNETSGNRADSHVNALTLTDNFTVAYQAGKVGNAGDFEAGNTEFFERADSSQLSTGDIDFTIGCWVNMESKPGNILRIMSKVDNSTTKEFRLGWYDVTDRFSFNITNSSGSDVGNVSADALGAPTLGTWYFVTAWHDSANDLVAIQVNDGTPNTATTTGAPADTTANFRIGANSATETNFWDGLLDECYYYKRLLTAPERTWLYNNGAGRTYSELAQAPTATPTASKTPTPSNTPTKTLTPTSTPIASSSLKSYWSIDSASGTSAPDDAPSDATNNSATLTNGVVIENTGASGKSLFFDGVNDYATVADHAEIKNNGSFTISAWINPASVVTDRTQYIVQKGAANKDYGFITLSTSVTPTPSGPVTVSSGSLAFQVGDLSPNQVLGPTLPVNTWTLVTGVYDAAAGELRLYLNGELVANTKVTGTVSMSTTALSFSSSVSANVYHGRLDEVRFYNRALTAGEVGTLFAAFSTPTPLASATPTSTPSTQTATPTALPAGGLPWGTGSDGSLTVNSGSTYNLNSQNNGSRSCADGGDAVTYNVTTLGATVAILSASPSSGCLSAGDEVMLINLEGTNSYYESVGRYEFLRVASVTGNTVAFTTQKIRFYGQGYASDTNVGTGAGQQRVALMRVPNYNNVTINGTLTANAWDGAKYGLLAFRAAGSLTGSGTITASGLGYRGSTAMDVPGEGPPNLGGPVGGGGHSQAGSCINTRPGGGGYAAKGGNTAGGNAYGIPSLAQIFMGAGGGSGGETGSGGQFCGSGGRGGGIIFMAGQTINFSGGISSDGVSGLGGGAGGSIRIEGYSVTLSTGSASGGTSSHLGPGSAGRIAVYYQNSLSGFSSSPTAYTALLGQAPTATPTSTAVDYATPSPWGNGADGNLTISSGNTFNITTQHADPNRLCGDSISYSVVSLSNTWAKVSSAPSSSCLVAGDEILLINLRGSDTAYANPGNYEYLRVGGIVGDTVYFTSDKINYYGANAGDDSNIGTSGSLQRVALVRVPNYNNVTVNGTLTTTTWNDLTGGVLAFRAAGTVSGSGTITASGLGYRGSVAMDTRGEGPPAYSYLFGGGGHSQAAGCGGTHPGGGGYYAKGGNTIGGEPYGIASLLQISFGSGGGSGGTTGQGGVFCGAGGIGGGMILMAGQTINFSGGITNNGGNGLGGGAGGAVLIRGHDITLGTLTISGGTSGYGGTGSLGRIAIYYSNSLANSGTICAQTSVFCQNNLAAPTATSTPTFTPTFTPTYQGDLVDSYTKTLLNMNGTDGSTTFSDFTGLHTFTANGNAQIDTAQYKSPGSSGLFDGAGDYISSADSADWRLDDGSNSNKWTVDFWVRFNGTPGTTVPFVSQYVDANNYWEIFKTGGLLVFQVKSGGTITINMTPSWSPAGNTWYHIAVVKNGTTGYLLFVNGTQLGSTQTDTDVLPDFAASLTVGSHGTTYHNGWIDEFRISKGIARWTSNFTPPNQISTATPTITMTPTYSPAVWETRAYTYSASIPHAVTSVAKGGTTDTYAYDSNGNMTCRVEGGVSFIQKYNAENRTSSIVKLETGSCASPGNYAAQWDFAYDGDGVRTGTLYTPYTSGSPGTPVVTTYYFGGVYEVTGSTARKYYALAGQTVAMKEGSTLSYFLNDNLGSVLAVLNSTNGAIVQQQRYLPFGQVRTISGSSVTATDYGYTHQRNLSDMGLIDYKARFYSAILGRFIQPDTIVPGGATPQALNRYSYVLNDPLSMVDPSGHWGKCRSGWSDYKCRRHLGKVQQLEREWDTEPPPPPPSSAFDYHTVLGPSSSASSSSCISSSCYSLLAGMDFPTVSSYGWSIAAYAEYYIATALKFRVLEDGRHVAAYPTRPAWWRKFLGLRGTYYNKSTVNRAFMTSSRGLGAGLFAGGVALFGNLVDYSPYGSNADKGYGQEFAVSLTVDTALNYFVAAGAAALVVTAFGVTAAPLLVIGLTAGIAIGTMWLVDQADLPEAMKDMGNDLVDSIQGE